MAAPKKEVFKQIGVTALRTPDGDFLPAVPLYVREADLKELNKAKGNDRDMRRLEEAFYDMFQEKNPRKEEEPCLDTKR